MSRFFEHRVIPIWTGVLATCVLVGLHTARRTPVSLAAGIPVLVVGLLIAAAAAQRTGGGLVTTGAYRVVRHPFYLGLILMLLGAAVVFNSPWGYLLLLPSVAVTLWRARAEELDLIQEYGDAYRRYQERTPFLIPVSPRRASPR